MNDRIAKLKAYLAESPSDPFLKHALALEYVKLGDDATAIAYFEQNAAQSPTYVATYYHLAKALERMKETAKAMVAYEEGMMQAKQAGDNHTYSELRSAYEDLVY
ncbi:MAG: hypothetical protein EBZ77_10465 [Chitinophagia bacterium]|nr:hypothetical protein [Chitinophagia bacterium]